MPEPRRTFSPEVSRLSLMVLLLLSALPLRGERIRVVVATRPAAVTLADVSVFQNATDVERWGDGPVFSAEIEREELDALRRDPRVRAVSVDEGGQGGLLESVPLIGADGLHAQGIDGSGITIAILDTGIDTDQRDFEGRIVAERCYCDNLDGTGCCPGGSVSRVGAGAAEDDHGHGTHVAGIAASGGAEAPVGVAPRANIVAVKVMDAENRFRSFTQIYRALEWIADARLDVDVVNMSLGSFALFTATECDSSAIALGMQPVIERLRNRGVLVTACTGNDGSTDSMWAPACMQDVLAIGATYDSPGDHCGTPGSTADDVACFTNSSGSLDFLAPGVNIFSSRRGGGGTTFNGTSMSAPHVAGTIALLKQKGGRLLSADFIRQTLATTGKPVTDSRNQLTFPRINAVAAVAATPPPPPGVRRRAVRR